MWRGDTMSIARTRVVDVEIIRYSTCTSLLPVQLQVHSGGSIIVLFHRHPSIRQVRTEKILATRSARCCELSSTRIYEGDTSTACCRSRSRPTNGTPRTILRTSHVLGIELSAGDTPWRFK
ncbi:hypothetical protein SCHPADRAFT_448296 [Schizopora paradoxa]|uniref:Uncharacterized protein n=1 Tax=Schizopora paradoxa TaxID=27342 RepID=A0A0H2RJN6_9AGAM|nr:hypothetical protein SCHPADRAFT_448296 [Schizopora paradoxa]